MRFKKTISLFIIAFHTLIKAQSSISGDIQLNNDFFMRDTSINAANTPLYDDLKSGTEAWINTNYRNEAWGFSAGLRIDLFYNSNMKYPGTPYSGQGFGAWYIEKTWDNLSLKGGYIYDQIGNGIIYRSFEDRGLGIDRALFGVQGKYKISENTSLKAFVGKQKDNFSLYQSLLKGANIETAWNKNENIQIYPGFAILNRTLDKTDMDLLVNNINALPFDQRFIPKYNVYAATFYNTLNYKNITWNIEAAYKTEDTFTDLNNALRQSKGNVLYTSFSFPLLKKMGWTIQAKRTENFRLSQSPFAANNFVLFNYLPAMSKQNSLRLPARYQAVTQDLSEMAYLADVNFKVNDKLDLESSYSYITDLKNKKNFQEIFGEIHVHAKEHVQLDFGAQYVEYNIDLYQNKPQSPFVYAFAPFAELTYTINKKHSLRSEIQYQYTKQDFGSWLFGLIEYNIAPAWSFALSGMYNAVPKNKNTAKKLYRNAFIAYSHKAHRFTLAYVTQVEGINCTGGVCRYEPAFSGIRLGLNSSF
jgi:hypothetical protein